MPLIQDRSIKKASALADYDALLEHAVESLPISSPTARATLYKSTRTALSSQLRSGKEPLPIATIESELRVFDDAVDRIEARIQVRESGLAPSTVVPDAAKSERVTSDGWLDDLLARASRDDVPTAPTASKSKLDQPTYSPALALVKRSESLPSSRIKQEVPPLEKRSTVHDTAPAILNSGAALEKPMSRIDELNRILRKLQHDSPGVEASALISEDGLTIASALSASMEETRVAGMTATLLNLGGRAAIELNRGSVQEVIVRGELGYAVLISAGRGALLLALTNESSKLGLVFFDMREAIRALAKVL
jgi:predicted regulator of Ras-like GTPase activity (Roadblock/LC7/MglB family)